MSTFDAVNFATSTGCGTPAHQAAINLCLVRGLNPDDYDRAAVSIPPIPNWQRVIAETLLQRALLDAFEVHP